MLIARKDWEALLSRLEAIERHVAENNGEALAEERRRLAARSNQIGELAKVLLKCAESIGGNAAMFEQETRQVPKSMRREIRSGLVDIRRYAENTREVLAGAIEDAALALRKHDGDVSTGMLRVLNGGRR